MENLNANDLDKLKSKIVESEVNLKNAEEEIKILKELKMKKDNPNLIKEENEDLELTHQLCLEDMKIYKEKILKLKEEQKAIDSKIIKIKQENEKLKKEKDINLQNQDSKSHKNIISNIKDLCISQNFQIRKNIFNDENNINVCENKEIENSEKIRQKKEEFGKKLDDIKNRSNEINSIIKKKNEKIKEYRNYLNEIYQYLTTYRDKLNISINNIIKKNNNNININFDEINTLYEKISIILFELDDIMFEIKNNFGQNIENILFNIQNNINQLYETNINNKCIEIEQLIDIMQVIFNDFEKNKNKFDTKNNIIIEEIKKLKNIHNNLINQDKERVKKNQKNENKIQNNKIIKKRFIEQSFLFNIKNVSKKLDLYKTINLFKNDEEDELNNNYCNLIKKNYHEICYIYDDYDIHDVYFTLKAVGLYGALSFTLGSFSFDLSYNIEIQEFSLDNIPSKYEKTNNFFISFNINLKNMESVKVHIKYKATKNLSFFSKGMIEERKIYRTDLYGLFAILSGVRAKYSLILRGGFDIVNFEDYIFIRNINNKEDIEYMWGGIVPPNGKMTRIMFSKKEAIWSFNHTLKFYSTNSKNIRDTKFYIPIEFIGGNNEIINIKTESPQASKIIIDEENRQYIIEYNNTNYNKGEIIIKGELRNKCKGEWTVDLTDEQIDKLMPEKDKKCKAQLKQIAEKIIKEFDENNKESDFEFLDYMKIGLWVYKNIKYDYNYTDKIQYNAIDIYNMKVGVCHHFTQLSNALLYSLGYKVLYITGFSCKNDSTFNLSTSHAYSLIKLKNNKWYPFDSTWGILTGKIHVGHVFKLFDNINDRSKGSDLIRFESDQVEGKFIK